MTFENGTHSVSEEHKDSLTAETWDQAEEYVLRFIQNRWKACRVSPYEIQPDKICLWYNIGRNKNHSGEKCIVLPGRTWQREDELRPSLPSNLSWSWCQSPYLVCVWLLLVCFFTQRQGNTIWAFPGADSPMGWKMIFPLSWYRTLQAFSSGSCTLLLGEHDRYSLLPSAMVIAQPYLAGTCPGGSISSTQPVITCNSQHSGDSMISLSTKQPSKGTATGVAT